MKLTGSVIIVTWNRPDYMRRCLTQLRAQEPQPDQIVVVDASPDDRTRKIVEEFPGVLYLFNAQGRGNTPHSRNVGILASEGDVLIFLDDDAFAHPDWFKNLMAAYGDDPGVGGVVARILNNHPGEETEGVEDIGRMRRDGVRLGHFAADPGRIIEVDHMLGACMSFRREAVARVGGFHGDYPGTNACDDSDMCLRVRLAGYRLLFTPGAVVDHVTAPRAAGNRSDLQSVFWHWCNNYIMLLRLYGFRPIFWGYVGHSIKHSLVSFARKIGGAFALLAVNITGPVAGILRGLRFLFAERGDPRRRDAIGQTITRYLEAQGEEQRAPTGNEAAP
jgi:GT2 family glycosyltransferase